METPGCGQEHGDLHQCDRRRPPVQLPAKHADQGYEENDDQHAIEKRRGGMAREGFANGAVARQPHQEVAAAALLKEAIRQRQQMLEESEP